MGSTIAEKILARAAGVPDVTAGDHVVCDVDAVMMNDLGSLGALERFESMDVDTVWDPSRIIMPMDHVAPSHTVDDANAKKRIRAFVEAQGIEHFYEVGTGIAHEVLPENGHVRPGELLVGSDSHTTSLGAFGCAGTGIGFTDMAYLLATGQTWFRVPETIRFEITGSLRAGVSAKDVVLWIAGRYGIDVARYRAIEFAGAVLEELALFDRFTFANMAIELGAKFGFTPIDDTVTAYVDERTDVSYEPQRADDDAEYRETHALDVSSLPPQVAKPHTVSNTVPVTDVVGVELDQVFIGSCTNGKFEDLERAAAILSGETVAEGTRLIVSPASREVLSRAEEAGITGTLIDAGAVVTNSTCGACIGMGMGVLGDDEVCLAAQNRNFKGRMGSDSSQIYLSSPETAAASAIEGRIADPREA